MRLDSFGAKAVSTALHAALVLGLLLPPNHGSAVSDLDADARQELLLWLKGQTS